MARFEDAAAGWYIYRERGGHVAMGQLNAALRAQGREPVAKRTYDHYAKLARLGYRDYVSINRLDLRHSNESIYDVADRSRYLDRELASPGQLIIPTANSIDVIRGQIGRVSEGFATLRTERSEIVLRAMHASRYNRGVLVFEQVGVERPVRVVEGIESNSAVELLLEFRSLLETDLVLEPSPYPVVSSRLVANLGANASLYSVLDAVHRTFDMFESARGFIDVAASGTSEAGPILPVARIRKLEFSNPFELLLYGGMAVATAVSIIINRVSAALGNAADATAKVQAVTHGRSAERRRDQRHNLEMQSLRLDNMKKAIDVSALFQEVRPVLREVSGVELPDPTEAERLRMEMLKDQAVEAATELTIQSSEPIVFEVEADDESPAP